MTKAPVGIPPPRYKGRGLGGPVVTPHSKLRPPVPRAGQVRRLALLGDLAVGMSDLVLVLAPAGFGKTTMISQWAADAGRPLAWATVGETDGDPVVLISTLMAALTASGARVAPFPGVLTGDEPAFSRRVLPQFQRTLESIDRAVTLVVDDVHAMAGTRPAVVLTAALDSLPAGSRLALVGRTRPDLPIALWRSQGRVREVGPDDLAFDFDEAAAFLAQLMGADPPKGLVAAILEATAGWPVAVYLQGLAVARGRVPPATASTALTDYLDAEVLGRIDQGLLEFLRRAAILNVLSAPACNDVVGVRNSRAMLRSAEQATLLVSRLHGDDGFYRLHPLLRDRLTRDLEEAEPQEARAVRARAARWCDAHDYADEAIAHAARSDDLDLLGTLAWKHAPEALAVGRTTTVRGWLARVSESDLAATPSLCITAAWTAVGAGEGVDALRWAEATGRALGPGWEDHLDRSSVAASLALLLVIPGMDGYEVSAARAGNSYAALPITHVFRPLSLMFQGAFLVLSGAVEEGMAHLGRGQALCESMALGSIWVECATLLTAAHAQRGDWGKAEESVAVARRVWTQQDLRDVKTTTLVMSGVSAFMHARSRQSSQARVDIHRAEAVLTGVSPVVPWVTVLVESFIARAQVLLDDRPAAVATARHARQVLDQIPASPFLEELNKTAEHAIGRSDELAQLSRAELRVWPMLLGRSTVGEIATQLHLSPETVKNHVSSIYRKLGVSTRRQLQDLADAHGWHDR
jgi:LuxR family maltose regulon positive regulatory protein